MHMPCQLVIKFSPSADAGKLNAQLNLTSDTGELLYSYEPLPVIPDGSITLGPIEVQVNLSTEISGQSSDSGKKPESAPTATTPAKPAPATPPRR